MWDENEGANYYVHRAWGNSVWDNQLGFFNIEKAANEAKLRELHKDIALLNM